MTAAAFLDEELETAESFLDAPAPAPTSTAEDFLDEPERQATPILLDDRFPTGEAAATPLEPVNLFGPDPDEPPAPIDMGADQANTIAREATADSEARRGIFSPDSAPYRLLGDQMAIDPLRYDDAAGELWKEGLIDSDQYFRMMNDAGDIKAAATARRDLELQAGQNPELKSALYGFGKGALQTVAAIGVGGSTGAATAPALGPGAIPAGIAAGVGSAILVGDMYDTFAEKLAAEDENIASFLAARELAPGYDIAGQLSSILVPTPFALSRLKTATSLIATERGAGEAAKFVARVTGTGAGIGLGTDLAVQGGMAAIDLASDRPVSFSPESVAISTTLGALTAGLGVKSNNRVYMADELPVLEQRVKLGTASREDAADYWTMRRTIDILREDQRLLEAGAVARSTVDFMGTRVLDTNTVINPRFQRDILTQAGFEPPFSSTTQPAAPPPAGRPALTYAAENPAAAVPASGQTAPAYTGQAFIDRGGPAPAFQGGTTALPGPAGVQALPGSAPALPEVPPVVSDQVDYFAGDKIQYTGGQAPEGFREFVYLEGLKAGTTGVARTPEAKATDLANARRIFEEEQAALKRLRESGKSDQMPKSPTEPSPKLQAAAATPEPTMVSNDTVSATAYRAPWQMSVDEWIKNPDVRVERRVNALKDVEAAVNRLGSEKIKMVHGLKDDETIEDWLFRESYAKPTWNKGRKSGQTAIEKWGKKASMPIFKDQQGEEILRKSVIDWIRGHRGGWLLKGETYSDPRFHTAASHKKFVEEAFRQGQPVPPEVLANYPELVPPSKLSPPPVEPAPPTEPTPNLQAAAATPEPVRQSQPVDPSVMRDQKKFLISEIDRLLAEAPDITPQTAGQQARPDLLSEYKGIEDQLAKLPNFSGDRFALQDRLKAIDEELLAAAPKVTIEIPGDGVFTIHNTKQTLTDFAAKAKNFPSTVSRPAVPAKPASNPSQIPAVASKPEDWIKASGGFTSNLSDRQNLNYIWQNSEVTVATDGRMLLLTRSGGKQPAKIQSVPLGSSGDTGWILSPKTFKPVSKEDILNFPDWRKIMPSQSSYIPLAEIDAGQLLVPVNQARAVLSSAGTSDSKIIQLSVNPDFTIGVSAKSQPSENSPGDEFNHNVQPGAKLVGQFDADRLRAVIGSMRSTGQSMFRIHSTSSESEMNPLVAENGNAFAVLMPMRASGPTGPVATDKTNKHLPVSIRDKSRIFWPSITPASPAKKSQSSSSKSKADAGPITPPAVQAAKPAPVKPPLAELNDAQIFADYPNAIAVHRGPGWAVPVILGGTDKVPVFQSPEIVEFYRTLAMKDPTLKNFSNALGRFYPGTGRVAVRPDLFLDENSALMTLSHEIGHFWSWADEGEIRLGNLGGHIQNIHNFLKTTFPIEKAGGPIITAQERRKLYNQARNSMPKGSKPEKDDPGLGDWQMEVASRYRELIQKLMDSRRLAYVGPQRGGFEDGAYDPNIREELISVSEWWKPFDYDTVPDSYLRYRHSAAELFADAISVLFMSPADLKQRAPNFWEALFNHMDARPQVKAKYLDIANRVLRGREAVLDHRISRDMQNFAKADEIFMAIHDEAANRRASITGLRDDILDQLWDQYYPITSALRTAEKQGKITLAEDDPYRYLTEEHPLSDSVVQLAMADMGRLAQRLDEAGIPRYELDMYLKDSRIAFEKQEIQAEVDGIMEIVGWEGSATKANPDGETPTTAADKLARQAELLGPEKTALLKATAAQWRDIFHDVVRRAWEKGVLTDEAWQKFNSNDSYATFTVLKHIRDFGSARIVGRKGTFQAVGRPSVEMMKKMVALHREAQRNEFRSVMVARLREALPEVVRDAPMKFNGKAMVPQQSQDRGWELITWREKGQLRGAHIQTRWARAFQINSPGIENGILRALNTVFRESIYKLIIQYNPSFQLGTGPVMDFTRSLRNMPGGVKGRVAFIKEMTREVFELAKSRDGRRVLLEGAGSLGGVVTGAPAGAVVGGALGSPGGFFGIISGGTLGGAVGANTAGAAGFYLGRMVASIVERALPWLPDDPTASLDWARGDFGRSALIRDMIENYAISGPWNYVGRGMTADPNDSMGALFAKFTQAGKPDSSNFLWKHLKSLFQEIEFAGQALQLIPKTAAYRVMSDKLGIPKQQTAYWIRNHIGLPNTAKKGAHIRNVEAVLPFANVWVRSLESMGKLMSGMDAKTMPAREWWMAFIIGGGGLWAVLQALASEGYFGEEIEKTYAGASEYVKSNLVAIPLGTVPSPTGDKSALLTVPLDHESRVLFGLIYKATRAGLRASKGEPIDVGLSDLITGFAATTPGVNPFLDVGRNWADFGMGKTPIDHRNLPILTEDERRVGGTAALGPMMGWTLDETGISNFFKFDPKANTFTEAALKPMPSINRFLRITDSGIRETERKTMDEEQRVRSQFKLGFPMWMQALRSEASYLQRKGDARNFREADRHMELRFWRRQYDKALDDMETAHELGNKSDVLSIRNQLIRDSQLFRRD